MSKDVQKEIIGAISKSFGSPLEEFGEYVADKIRFLRWKSAVRILERAREISQEKGGEDQVPPLKFLLPFLEGCSLESEVEDGNRVEEMWAELLVASQKDYSDDYVYLIDVLKKLSPSGAKLIKKLGSSVEEESGTFSSIVGNLSVIDKNVEARLRYPLLDSANDFPNVDLFLSAMEDLAKEYPVHFLYVGEPSDGSPSLFRYVQFQDTDFEVDEFEILGMDRSGTLAFRELELNFVEYGFRKRKIVEPNYEGRYYPLSFGYVALTSFGYRLFSVCEGNVSGGTQ